MRKNLFIICAILLSTALSAQEYKASNGEVNMLSKRGEKILPEAGNIAIGIDASPFLNYLGNFISTSPTGSLNLEPMKTGLSSLGTSQIYVKYYLDDKTAIRVVGKIQYDHSSSKHKIGKDIVPFPDKEKDFVFDILNTKKQGFGLGADYLMYRGKGRLQGYMGGGLHVYHQRTAETHKYGNPMTPVFPHPNTAIAGAGEAPSGDRVLSNSDLIELGTVARGILGVEYFILPKVSLGGELGLGLALKTRGGGKIEREYWDGTQRIVEERKHDKYPTKTDFNLDTFVNGSIFFMFHF